MTKGLGGMARLIGQSRLETRDPYTGWRNRAGVESQPIKTWNVN